MWSEKGDSWGKGPTSCIVVFWIVSSSLVPAELLNIPSGRYLLQLPWAALQDCICVMPYPIRKHPEIIVHMLKEKKRLDILGIIRCKNCLFFFFKQP